MPIARFQMPDGRVARFEVPDGTTPEQAQNLAAKYFTESSIPSPTDGMTSAEKRLAGVGQGAAEVARNVQAADAKLGQLPIPLLRAADWFRGKVTGELSAQAERRLADESAEAKRTDAALLATPEGRRGSFVGKVAATVPTILIPGVNTLAGATGAGALTGALTTEGGLGERATGALYGAAGGAAGRALGDAVGAGVRKIGAAREASRAAQKAANATRDATLAASREAGYVVTPSQAGSGGMVNSLLEGLGGKIKTQQAASVKNQAVTDRLVRQSLGLADDVPISVETLAGVRNQAGQAYEALRGLGHIKADADLKLALKAATQQSANAAKSFPGLVKASPVDDIVRSLDQPSFDAGDAVDAVKVLRGEADKFYGAGDKATGKAIKGIASAMEDALERSAKASNVPGLVDGFREARRLIAKTYSVQGSLNHGAGTVSAQKLAAQLNKGKPLSGELKKVAEFAQAFPKAAQSGVDVPAFSPLDVFSGGIGVGLQSPTLLAATAARPAARSVVLNPAYQSMMVNGPSYQAGLLGRAASGLLTSTPIQKAIPGAGGLLSSQYAR